MWFDSKKMFLFRRPSKIVNHTYFIRAKILWIASMICTLSTRLRPTHIWHWCAASLATLQSCIAARKWKSNSIAREIVLYNMKLKLEILEDQNLVLRWDCHCVMTSVTHTYINEIVFFLNFHWDNLSISLVNGIILIINHIAS